MIMADNGLIHHFEGTSGLTQLIYRGSKTQHFEGGVRTDAFIRWPDVIERGSAAGDIIHVSDLFTTFARVAGAMDYIPCDRNICLDPGNANRWQTCGMAACFCC